jgi:galactokinase
MALGYEQLASRFVARFGRPPRWVVRAPGRVNLIGEHTDYNDGFVLPLAMDRAVWIALDARQDRRVEVYSVDFQSHAGFDLDNLAKDGDDWIEYVKGTAWSLREAGFSLVGWEGVIEGDVPVGAGLSSSAAVELATARAMAAAASLPWDAVAMAKLAQRAENRWVGVNCGIMDQLISAVGRENCAVLIDCRSLACTPVAFPPGAAVAVLDTSTRRGLVDSAYNERRRQCEATAKFFGVRALRDVDLETFRRRAGELDGATRRRALHVITENARTLRAVEAMRRSDLTALGGLLNASHASLRDDFEVSSTALDAMVRSAVAQAGCYGARMTGAGFGGCAVALVDAAAAKTFAEAVAADYRQQTSLTPAVYVCTATSGAEIVEAS